MKKKRKQKKSCNGTEIQTKIARTKCYYNTMTTAIEAITLQIVTQAKRRSDRRNKIPTIVVNLRTQNRN